MINHDAAYTQVLCTYLDTKDDKHAFKELLSGYLAQIRAGMVSKCTLLNMAHYGLARATPRMCNAVATQSSRHHSSVRNVAFVPPLRMSLRAT
jgi:hypothetical protein